MFNTTKDQDAVSTANFSTVATSDKSSTSAQTPKKKNARSPFLEILRKARYTFKRQITRDAQMKKSAIEHVLKLSDKDANMDDLVFLGNFYDMVETRLLDSGRFLRDCKRLGLNAFHVAQHVIFDGNKKLDEVLVSGLEKAYGNEILKMEEPIYTKEELLKGKLFPKEVGLNNDAELNKVA